MERALVVAEDSEVGRQLLKEAATLAAGIDAELVVLQVLDEKRYDGSLERKVQSGNSNQIDSIDDITEELRLTADALASDIVDGVSYQSIGRVGKLPDIIIDTAVNMDCDHIFIVGERRSPTGKVVFGDNAQSVILQFDGPVTTLIDN
ncbi:universal stress protein [Halalkalicoccus tibetensis]|uniref:Universal stress protein n=1 Tax=Halalkalicoccus tibetensis TaxID=175632 RepID=A0ABD5V8Z6_9EURY